MSEEALQIAEKRKEAKGNEERRYTQLNAEFQRIERKNKIAFLSEQCKEIEENNRKRKTKVLFRKIKAIKGKFHVKMGTIKDRNGMDITEAEDIKKRWQEHRKKVKVKSLSHVRLFATLWTVAHQPPPSWDSPGKNTGVGCNFLLQGIFLTQG